MVTMRLLTSRHICVLCVAVLAAGCRSDNIFDSPAEVVKPDVCHEISGTQLEPGNGYPSGIVNLVAADSVLVLKTANPLNHNQFHIYDLSTGQYVGSYVGRGRGPGELISPVLSGTFSDEEYGRSLYIFALNDNAAYGLDIPPGSGEEQNMPLFKIGALPSGTLNALPYHDSLHCIKKPQRTGMDYSICDRTGKILRTFNVYGDVSGTGCFDRLSSADIIMPGGSPVAMAMSFLPQINFLNLETGDRHAVVLPGRHVSWTDAMTGENDDKKVYYISICGSAGHLFALYFGIPFDTWVKGAGIPHIHIFDWSGNFLCDLSLHEKIKAITCDSDERIYGVDQDDRVYRYDMDLSFNHEKLIPE